MRSKLSARDTDETVEALERARNGKDEALQILMKEKAEEVTKTRAVTMQLEELRVAMQQQGGEPIEGGYGAAGGHIWTDG